MTSRLFSRRRVLTGAAALTTAAILPRASLGADWRPTETVRLIVPAAPGGTTDVMGRLLAVHLQKAWGQSAVVENRSGGGGMNGTDQLARAAPDGYTIGMLETSTVLHKWLHKAVPFDITADFAPIALIARSALILFTHPSLPATDLTQLIALARASPGALQVGTPGVGTPHYLTAALLNHRAKVDIAPLSYRGTAPALNDLVGGHVKMIWAAPVAVMPFVGTGQVKALATASAQRLGTLPQLATVAEQGLPGFELELWFGMAAPARTPPAIVESYQALLREIASERHVQARIEAQSFRIDFRDHVAFRAMIVREHTRLGEAIRAAGIGPT